MTDRELLKDAAKAAGYEVEVDHKGVFHIHEGTGPQSWRPWNPLNDDGDALRLANSLQMNVDFCCYRVVRGARIDVIEDAEHGLPAIRRAIVRAAAEIGKGMKNA